MALRPWLNDVEKLFRELVFLFCILACKRLYYIAPSYMRWCWRWSQKRPHNLLAGYKQCFLEIEPCDANIKNQERLWSHHKHDDLMTCWPTANAVNIQRSCTADDIGIYTVFVIAFEHLQRTVVVLIIPEQRPKSLTAMILLYCILTCAKNVEWETEYVEILQLKWFINFGHRLQCAKAEIIALNQNCR